MGSDKTKDYKTGICYLSDKNVAGLPGIWMMCLSRVTGVFKHNGYSTKRARLVRNRDNHLIKTEHILAMI